MGGRKKRPVDDVKQGYVTVIPTVAVYKICKQYRAGFLEQHGFDAVLERVSKWPSLVLDENELNANDDFSSDAKVELSPEVERIIIKDAERTFSEESHRKKLAQFLSIIHYNFKDYHQGRAQENS